MLDTNNVEDSCGEAILGAGMDEYVIVVETGYKLASANHKITPTEPMERLAAERMFTEMMDGGHPELLPEKHNTSFLEVSPVEFLRLHRAMGGAVELDRVTLARVHGAAH
ncbi:hypothetical protein [Arthrobacter koreensis]|uniref:Uncharacterized protein n=1 Tax=Arthrobacter koreensis TaxID=199136 RepID=A0ABY6FTN8_9MICC|nr:hypothetical protein [Arthrobacter koreensis]UYB36294.1 hypothetical protein N9A08_00935 [Arthrobacter koreensis]